MTLGMASIGAVSIFESPEVRGVLAASAFLCLSVTLVYVALAIRSWWVGSAGEAHPSEHLDDFERMVDSGSLSRQELARVRGAIVSQSKDPLSLSEGSKSTNPLNSSSEKATDPTPPSSPSLP